MKETLRKELEAFLRHVNKHCMDRYGNLLVMDSEDESIRKMYPSSTIESIVDNYLKNILK